MFIPQILGQKRDCSEFIPRGVLSVIWGRGVLPGSPTSDPISDQNMPFSHPFSDLAWSVTIFLWLCCNVITLGIIAEVKNWYNSAGLIYFGYLSFSTIHLELKREIQYYTLLRFP